jgi:hypothetical protein
MAEFKPPIHLRTTEELLDIAGAPENWNNDAVEQAKTELEIRNISEEQINHAKYLSKKTAKYEELKRAKESYSIFDFLFNPFPTLLEVLVSWELKKDGYWKKAEQQKTIRIAIVLILLVITIYLNLT